MSCDPKTDLESVEEFFEYLTTDKLPEHWARRWLRKLPPRQAFEIIYYLQEELGLLPDTFEMCRACRALFDSDREGTCIDSTSRLRGKPVPMKYWGNWHDECLPERLREIEDD